MKIRNWFTLIFVVLPAFTFIVNSQTQNVSTDEQPKVVKAVAPNYPPAARAISTIKIIEQVIVEVKINSDGRVTAANTKSGYILLKKSSEKAALRWQFNAVENKKQYRTCTISFIYRLDGDRENPEIVFNPPYEVEIISGENKPSYNSENSKVIKS